MQWSTTGTQRYRGPELEFGAFPRHEWRARLCEGDEVYDSLYVSDGSILPCLVGVNPFLNISAIAECKVRALIREPKWNVDERTNQEPATCDGKPTANGSFAACSPEIRPPRHLLR